jgi:hypothetical protein
MSVCVLPLPHASLHSLLQLKAHLTIVMAAGYCAVTWCGSPYSALLYSVACLRLQPLSTIITKVKYWLTDGIKILFSSSVSSTLSTFLGLYLYLYLFSWPVTARPSLSCLPIVRMRDGFAVNVINEETCFCHQCTHRTAQRNISHHIMWGTCMRAW